MAYADVTTATKKLIHKLGKFIEFFSESVSAVII